ncbi:cellulase family glycosylhydrolase [Persicobacter diffluens]|uniref:cellulase n=1 Tax=Persicobacter diffluens TaxID=981 RepID=A0AAN4W179_9BACT|nr:hypothetical protein PEDI_43530 [Persicobacter diffluens]
MKQLNSLFIARKNCRWQIILCLLFFTVQTAQAQHYLYSRAGALEDENGQLVRLTGVNWFGFETTELVPHGLWARDLKSMLVQIKDQGFNCIRIPWCNAMLRPGASIKINSFGVDAYTGVSPMNAYEATLNKPIEILDIMVEWCQEHDIKIILDNHSREPGGYMNETLWYTEDCPETQWISDWVFMADRYRDYDAVVAMDLNNEPHGEASWGTGNPLTDWNKAAERCGNAILEVNPHVLIMIEGVEKYGEDVYWWGGNLMGVRDFPVQLSNPEKLVYAPHEYGPTVFQQDWFTAPEFPENLPQVWEQHFGYLYSEGISPLFVGEFGIRDAGGADEVWFDAFLKYMAADYSWTFWCWNPNSGDTGGLLGDNWSDIVSWKMEKIRPYLAPLIKSDSGALPTTGLELALEQLEVEGEGGTFETIVWCEGGWQSFVEDEWIILLQAEGITEDKLVFKVAPNEEESSRRAYISVFDETDTVQLEITQKGQSSGSSCAQPLNAILPLVQDGTGHYCWLIEEDIAFINSWNMVKVQVNGQDYTNQWSNAFPEKINGKYYIEYEGDVPYAHLEVKSSSSQRIVLAPDEEMVVFPNPSFGKIRLNITGKEIKNLRIVDFSGKLVEEPQITFYDHHLMEIFLNPGSYLLRIICEDGSLIQEQVLVL